MKSKSFTERVNSDAVLNRKMEKVDLESRLPLEAVFHRLAEDRKKHIYGERQHAKFEGWHYKVEYDFWKKESDNDPNDSEILGFEGDEEFGFRHELTSQECWLSYTLRRAYFEESMAFFRTLDLGIAHKLLRGDFWHQADRKNTVVSTSFTLPNLDEIYEFIGEHIKYTVKNH